MFWLNRVGWGFWGSLWLDLWLLGVKWFVDLMLCYWGCWFVRNWLDFLDFNVIGGRVVGDVVLLVSSFGDWLGDVGW